MGRWSSILYTASGKSMRVTYVLVSAHIRDPLTIARSDFICGHSQSMKRDYMRQLHVIVTVGALTMLTYWSCPHLPV